MLSFMNLRTRATLPTVSLREKANYYKAFTSPNPDVNAVVLDAAGQAVGRVTYALSPLCGDKLFLFNISIEPSLRRQGLGSAVLVHLAQRYDRPIIPVKELHTSFWHKVRRLKMPGLRIGAQLSVGCMDKEAERWSHLKADAERLDRLITERLAVSREPWDVAVGRGLPAHDKA